MTKIIIVLVLLLPISAAVADIDKGFAAYEKGDYATALREWEPLAEQGDDRAQYNLGRLYLDGHGVPQDYSTAVKWYTLAAEQGFAKAQFNLGQMYRKGEGVPQDYATAVKWFSLAAEQGNAVAQSFLGWMYGMGKGVLRDYVRAHMWWNIAAAQGDENAIKNRDKVAGMMTSSQLEEAQKLAYECAKKNYKDC